jgi:hypothetical protein
MLSTSDPLKNLDKLEGLLRYDAKEDPEADLMKALPREQKEWLSKEFAKQPAHLLRSQELQAILDRMPSVANANQFERETLQNLQKQLQWTNRDQETRHPDERQQVFYFMQDEQLQKGRIQFRKDSNPKKGNAAQDDAHRFFVETQTPRLGHVRVDFRMHKGNVELDFADATGAAQAAVLAERVSLAQELESIGLSLGTMAYHLLRNDKEGPLNKNLGTPLSRSSSSRLDLLA